MENKEIKKITNGQKTQSEFRDANLTEEMDFDALVPNEDDLKEIEEEFDLEEEYLQLANEASDIDVGDPVKMYLRAIGQYRLLTAEEEINLAKKIEKGRFAKMILECCDNNAEVKALIGEEKNRIIEVMSEIISVEDVLEEKKLSEEAHRQLEIINREGKEAKKQLVNSNLRLVVNNAKKYKSNKTMTFLDMIQEGNIGLMKTADKFDYRMGHRFSTYATWWIKQAITRALMDQDRNIRIPVHLQESMSKLNKATKKLVLELDREPAIEEIALEADMSLAKAKELYRYAQDTESLDKPVGEEEDTNRGTLISDENAILPDENAVNVGLREDLEKIMQMLDEREKKIIAERNGWYDGRIKTLEEIGEELGITRERVRQIESRAMRKLKNRAYRMDMDSYLKN